MKFDLNKKVKKLNGDYFNYRNPDGSDKFTSMATMVANILVNRVSKDFDKTMKNNALAQKIYPDLDKLDQPKNFEIDKGDFEIIITALKEVELEDLYKAQIYSELMSQKEAQKK